MTEWKITVNSSVYLLKYKRISTEAQQRYCKELGIDATLLVLVLYLIFREKLIECVQVVKPSSKWITILRKNF